MTTTRQLYTSQMSSNARRTRLCIAHLGADITLVECSLGDPAARAKVAAINPNGKIPVLVEGDFVLWESNAINQYLCDLTPGQTLLPAAPKARADVNRWLYWLTAHLSPACGGLNFEHFVKKALGRGEPDPNASAAHTAELHRFAKVVDQHLAGQHLAGQHLATRQWLANDALSLADYSLAATLMHSDRGQYPLQPYEHLRAHVARIRETPAWRMTEG